MIKNLSFISIVNKQNKVIKKLIFLTAFSLCVSSFFVCKVKANGTKYLVKYGQPQSVIVIPENPSKAVKQAVTELQYHIKRASGAVLKTKSSKQAKSVPSDWIRIIFKQDKDLSKETFEVKTKGNKLIFIGDGQTVDTLFWAVDHYLDTKLGVRWLWPGDVGTYVPEHKNIELPDIDVKHRPVLSQRRFRMHIKRVHEGKKKYLSPYILLSDSQFNKQLNETNQWLDRFQMGIRKKPRFGHSFTKWWKRYGKKHPDYFAKSPGSKKRQPYPKPTWVKLNVSNTKVDDQIIKEWKKAGTPDKWRVSPNDGTGFDTRKKTRAMDDPPYQSPWAVWRGDTNLTARYVKFWNRLIKKMRKINPDIHLYVYAYNQYRKPPMHGLKLEPNIVVGFVPAFDKRARARWFGWHKAGAHQLYLRPNWWNIAVAVPYLPLHREGDFFKFAQSHGMLGFDSDSLRGDWGVKSPLYYLIARLMVHPEMSVNDVIDEYCSAFGYAAPDIKRYLRYWQWYSKKLKYHYRNPLPDTLVDKVIKKHDLHVSYLSQGWKTMPYLYTDDVLQKGYDILDKAKEDARNDNSYVKKRIQFLRDGLDHLKLTRDVVAMGYSMNINSSSKEIKKYKELVKKLKEMRKKLANKNVVSPEVLYRTEEKWAESVTIPNLLLKKKK